MRLPAFLTGTLMVGWCALSALAAGERARASAPRRPAARPAATRPAARPAATRPAPRKPGPAVASREPALSPEQAEFFEKEIRPVLAEHCYSCHGPNIQQAGLRVDSRAALLKGTDRGQPALVPGDPEKSLLIRAVRHTGSVKMPPQGKLPDRAIEALEQWVRMGAPWPGSGEARPAASAGAASPGAHWAFRPVRKPAIPRVRNRAWVRTPIDAFILARLEAKGLQPSPMADRRTLIRRAYFDLIGLPPEPEEVEAFVRDRAPDAFERVVDRLLASPHYGERWGRYWLDVARYADSKGYVFQEERRYPYAYTYRDWVVRAFNEDLPYDQFLIQQIAADRLALGEDRRPLAALGFLTVGRRFLNNIHDIIDDRLDVVFRGTQALTIGCARCHDHKYDPIPIRDYYSLYGVFASSVEPRELPVLEEPKRTAEYLAFEQQLKQRQEEVERYLAERHAEILQRARARIAESLLAAREAERPGADPLALAQRYDLPPALIVRWKEFLADTRKGHHPIFAPWHVLAAIPDAEWPARAAERMAGFAANREPGGRLHPRVAALFAGTPPASLRELAERYAALLAAPPLEDDELLHALDSIGGPLNIDRDDIEPFLNRAERNRLRALRQRVEELKASSPAAPPRAMVLVDAERPVTPRVFLRGNPNNPGEPVPRQFLAVLSGPDRKPFQEGSGRLELARAIASRDNPLTARVMVNRVWLWHFGQALVRTPSDFGLRSEPPTHPELLDYLASWFMENGWSLKKLHRLIMLSSVYRQSSAIRPACARIDPENTLYWRMNRRRLDFEAMRDAMLAAAGRLDRTLGGPPVDITRPPFATRRTLYGFIDRQNLPAMYRVFDFASPDTHSPQRFNTTVPQQALFLLNHPFVVEQAKHLAARKEVAEAPTPQARLERLYRILYGRAPEPAEVALALAFLKGSGTAQSAAGSPSGLSPWERLAQALLVSNEFMFVD